MRLARLCLLLIVALALRVSAATPLGDVLQLAAGLAHACALTSSGAVKCWGWNYAGQLGNGTTSDAIAAVDVAGLGAGVTSIAAGAYHTCAVVNGGVKCWGRNDGGQLGNGTTVDSAIPVDVIGIGSGASALAAGASHSCAVVNGSAKCWGYNHTSQLGDGTDVDSLVPVQVAGLASGVTSMTAGWGHTCAVVNGGIECWGFNFDGELGRGTATYSEPIAAAAVGLAAGATQVVAGDYHTCAAVNAGVRCWGHNVAGQLGNGTTADTATPVPVIGLSSGASTIAAGGNTTCAIVSGATQCWGFNGDGELGDGTTTSSDTPVAVSGLAAGAIALAVGAYVSCAVVAGGAKCWGANNSGQLGYGVSVRQSMPGDVIGVASGVSAMAGGWTHTCAVVGPGAAKCWGNNQWGQLGDGTLSSATVPVDVVGLGSGVSQVSAAYYHTCAIVNGGAQCWGSGLFGALGDGTTNDSATPVPVTGLGSGVTAIAAGVDHTCAAVGGAAKCWGFNDTGQLGNGTTTMSSQPVDVIGLGSGVTSISAGVHHSCAVANGAVKCWGQNVNGELGNGTVVSSTTSVGVTGLSSGATVVAVGDGHSCAIVYGAIKCWGYNPYGELGNGTTVTSLLPVDVAGIGSGATSLAAGRFHSCAIVSGAARCWGDNTASQIGDGTNVNALTPAEPIGLFSGVTVVAAGTNQSCAAVFGAAKCWGFGPAGELGNGVRTFSTVPVTVLNSPPTVTTAGASAVAANGATLNALVNSNSAASNASFAYGLTTAYGYFVVAVENPLAPNANSATASATIIGLACNTTYHFRAIATNANGIGNGGDVIFTTAPCANTTVTTTFLVSDINPIADQTRITYTATVTGTSPTGTVAFSDNGTDIPGCGAIPLAGSGNARPVACATTAFVGTHAIAARYSGDATNSPSLSIPLDEQVFAASPIMGSIVTNPYGPLSVSGGMLNGSLFSLAAPHASIQLGTGPGSSGAYVEIDFDSLHISGTTTFTIYSGAPGQVVVLRVTGMTPSALGGTLQAQGGNGAPPPELHLWNPNGFTVATPAKVIAPSGITLDALGASWNIGKDVVNAGLVDGGVTLALMGAGIHGGGAFRGDAIRLHTFGNANNPANGAHYLSNSLQLFPSSGTDALLTINDYGVNPQFLNLKVNGNASISMPSLWPAGMALPANNAPVPAGGMRPAGVPEPTYGGGSIILQATGTVTLLGGASNDLAFPGGIVLLSGSTLNLAGVSVNQGWTAAGKAFQGLYFESPDIISGSTVSILSNDLNWTNFSSMPAGHFHISRLTQMPDGTLGYSAADSTAPHLNRYSQLIDAAANGQCWTCLINYTPIDVQ